MLFMDVDRMINTLQKCLRRIFDRMVKIFEISDDALHMVTGSNAPGIQTTSRVTLMIVYERDSGWPTVLKNILWPILRIKGGWFFCDNVDKVHTIVKPAISDSKTSTLIQLTQDRRHEALLAKTMPQD